jgi:hypothetical protein
MVPKPADAEDALPPNRVSAAEELPWRGSGYELAVVAAVLSSLFPVTQILLTLVIGPLTRAAVVSATKASSSTYSVRSWPSSSCQKRFKSGM